MKAIQIIGRLRERYSNKYTQTPNKDKDHYIKWLQDEYAELAMKLANGDNKEKEALHIDSVSGRSELLFDLLRFVMPKVFTNVALKNIVKQFLAQIK